MKKPPEKLLIATKNVGKITEIRDLLKDLNIQLLALGSFPRAPDIVEDGETFEDNARKKAAVIAQFTGIDTVADDSGLCIDALNGRPGVLSARYAGDNASDEQRCARVLEEMNDVPDELRTARFVCVIALVTSKNLQKFFKGVCEGKITRNMRGRAGFGYDPIFYHPESGCTFAEMGPETKNRVSHRGRALTMFRDYLKELSR